MKSKLFLLVFIMCFGKFVSAQCTRSANFSPGPDYNLEGVATITFLDDGSKTLSFDSDFQTVSGPDLHVYLSNVQTVETPGGVLQTEDTIEIGLLQSSSGAQSYDLSSFSSIEAIDSYNYVSIHCKQYDHYWGTAGFALSIGNDCTSLLVNTVQDSFFTIYPTIVQNGKLFIEFEDASIRFLNIYSILGELMSNMTLYNRQNEIDMSQLDRGIYILKLEVGSRVYTQKIIVK